MPIERGPPWQPRAVASCTRGYCRKSTTSWPDTRGDTVGHSATHLKPCSKKPCGASWNWTATPYQRLEAEFPTGVHDLPRNTTVCLECDNKYISSRADTRFCSQS